MISISILSKKSLLLASLLLGFASFASAQNMYTFQARVNGTQVGNAFASYTTTNGTCGTNGNVSYTSTAYTMTGWTYQTPSGGGGLASGYTFTFIAFPNGNGSPSTCPTAGWQGNLQGTKISFIATSYLACSNSQNPQTDWEGGYVIFQPGTTPANSYFTTAGYCSPS